MRKYYPGITLFKLLGCILVVLSHIIIPAFYNRVYHQLAFLSLLNIIVPCFYIISGFLAYQGWSHASNADKYVIKYLKRIITIYCLFVLLYIAVDLINAASSGKIVGYFTFSTLKKIILIIFLQGPYAQLWFIPPLIFGIAVSYYLVNKVSVNYVLIIGFITFIAVMLTTGSLHVLVKNVKIPDFYGLIALREISRHFIGEGFIYVLTGVIIAKRENILSKANLPALILLCSCFTVAEYFILCNLPLRVARNSGSFSSLPNSILLFYGIFCIKAKWIIPYRRALNLFSIVIFFSHYTLMYINGKLMDLKITNLTEIKVFYLITLIFIEGAFITYLITRFEKNKTHLAIANP